MFPSKTSVDAHIESQYVAEIFVFFAKFVTLLVGWHKAFAACKGIRLDVAAGMGHTQPFEDFQLTQLLAA